MIIPIKTIQLDQESKGHHYKRSLNSPLLKSKGVIALTAMMETLTGGDSPGRPNKASTYKSKYKKSKTSSKKGLAKLIQLLIDNSLDEDLLFHKTGIPKCFPYLTRQVPKSWCTLNGNFHTEEEVS